MRRRRFLGAVGASAALGVTGCVGGSDDPEYDKTQADFDPEIRPYDETYPGAGVTMFRNGLRRLGYYPDAVMLVCPNPFEQPELEVLRQYVQDGGAAA